MWQMGIFLDSNDTEHFRHHGKFSWTVLPYVIAMWVQQCGFVYALQSLDCSYVYDSGFTPHSGHF